MIASTLSELQKERVLRRITALWAFGEAGLGGVLHALRLPFTGLFVGSLSVLCITLIAAVSDRAPRRVLQSLLLVLIVKAAVSPHSPPPAYLAVAFQGAMGYLLYSAFRVSRFSVQLLALLALLESAFQKLITLVLFYGSSFRIALDKLTAFMGTEISSSLPRGSILIPAIYVGIYLVGGLLCGWWTWRVLRNFDRDAETLPHPPLGIGNGPEARRRSKLPIAALSVFILIAVTLYFGSGSKAEGALAVTGALLWTVCALLLWYGIIAPLALRLLRRYLGRQRRRHGAEVEQLLQTLPAFRQLAAAAWTQSAERKSGARLPYFLRLLVHWSITWSPAGLQEQPA